MNLGGAAVLKFAGDHGQLLVGVIDVGSPRTGKLGWAVHKGTHEAHGNDLDEFLDCFAAQCDGCPAALGFEAPLFIPVRREALLITNARKGEGERPWSASAGANAMAIGIAIAVHTLAGLRERLPGYSVTLDPRGFTSKAHTMLVFEAFVSGASKGTSHHDDAAIAARAFASGIGEFEMMNAIDEREILSLSGAALIHTRWLEPSMEALTSPCLVVKP